MRVEEDGRISFRWTGKLALGLSALVGMFSGISGYVASYVRTQAMQEMRVERIEKDHENLRSMVASQMVGALRFDDFRRLNERDHEEIKADIRELRNEVALALGRGQHRDKRPQYGPENLRTMAGGKGNGSALLQ